MLFNGNQSYSMLANKERTRSAKGFYESHDRSAIIVWIGFRKPCLVRNMKRRTIPPKRIAPAPLCARKCIE